MIDWKARVKNKAFWMAIIPLFIVFVTQVCAIFGYTIDLSVLSDQLLGIIGTVFSILVTIGVVVDTSTDGFSDN